MGAIVYLLQVSACMGLFYGFYYLMLSRLTFFTINRWYLVVTLVLSFVIPLLTITVRPDSAPIIKEAVYVNQLQTFQTPGPLTYSPQQVIEPAINWLGVLKMGYLLAVIVLFIRLMVMLAAFFSNVKSKKSTKIGNVHILHGDKKLNNGSFLNYIFINDDELSYDEIQQIIEHEMLHVKLLHSVDRILVKIAQIVLWFNPFVYLYARAIEENHEFEVDREIGMANDKSKYADMLLHLSVARQGMLYNSFSMVPLKKRITMLFTKPTNHMKKVIYLLALPVVLLSCLAFARLKNDAPVKVENSRVNEKRPVSLSDVQTHKVTAQAKADTIKQKPKPPLSKIKAEKTKPAAVVSQKSFLLERPVAEPSIRIGEQPFYTRTHMVYDNKPPHDKITFRYTGGSASANLGVDDIAGAFIDGEFYDENAIKNITPEKAAQLEPTREGFNPKKIPDGPYAVPFSFKTKRTPAPDVKQSGKVNQPASPGLVITNIGKKQPGKSAEVNRNNSILQKRGLMLAKEILNRGSYDQFYNRIQFNATDGKNYDMVVCKIGTGLTTMSIKPKAKAGLLIDGVFYEENEVKKMPASKTETLEMWRDGLDAKKVPSGYIAAFSLRTKKAITDTDQ
jgi:hypothetical protein